MKDYKIWVSYHQDEQIGRFDLRDDDHHILYGTHKDAEHKNINYMNPVYSEMVTMWYVWKNNIKSEYVGFEHYRRHLDVVRMPEDGWCQVFRAMDFGKETIYEQYARCHNAKDMDLMLSILDKKFGKVNAYSRHIVDGHCLIVNCTFLMKWEDFVAMCKFLFPLLEAFEKKVFGEITALRSERLERFRGKARTDFGRDGEVYQMRVISFLAERLISAWIDHHLKWWNGIDVAIVNYNTTELTQAAIRSLWKCTPGCKVTVFDNSDKEAFKAGEPLCAVTVIDNTRGQVVNFEEMVKTYYKEHEDDLNPNNFGSAKHCRSVDALMDLLPDGFVLMDSDVLVTTDIRGIVDRSKAIVGEEHRKHGVPLLLPFICWINVPMLREKHIRYFNGDKMWAMSDRYPDNFYDTGAWVFEEVKSKGLPWKETGVGQYILHLGHGSWRDRNAKEWLETYKQYHE